MTINPRLTIIYAKSHKLKEIKLNYIMSIIQNTQTDKKLRIVYVNVNLKCKANTHKNILRTCKQSCAV